jgi:hypothetical protein
MPTRIEPSRLRILLACLAQLDSVGGIAAEHAQNLSRFSEFLVGQSGDFVRNYPS